MVRIDRVAALLGLLPVWASANATIAGRVTDPSGLAVKGAVVRLLNGPEMVAQTESVDAGQFLLTAGAPCDCIVRAEREGFRAVEQRAVFGREASLRFTEVAGQTASVTVPGRILEPAVDLRNAEVFASTLFTRDDQVLQQLDAGINTGQHEGGGKSLEIRRFGFNLDHGGVNGGLKVMVDGVQQNQGSQGHGQGYLGSLKALSPELIEDVTIINGPFSAEYGDFSGLGVVQVHQRESLPEQLMVRLQGGNFDTGRGFVAFSPAIDQVDSYIAYEGSYTDGPFLSPGRYRRDNVNANYAKVLRPNEKLGFRFLFGRNDFYSSGQIPLDLVSEGLLDRFGYIDPTDGGKVWLGTLSTNYTQAFAGGDRFRADAFVDRSLFDLYSNFTFFLNNPATGDGIQQHDSRLQEGANAQYAHPHKLWGAAGMLVVGANYLDNQINVGLYPREGRVPLGVQTRADARVTDGAGYAQESLSFFHDRLVVGAGLRLDAFRWDVQDKVDATNSGTKDAARWQPKVNIAYTPARAIPLTLYANYGRGINSEDARGVVQRPDAPRLATTDFYQVGTSSNFGRASFSTDLFLINHSNEQVYIPDDGTFEFKGPSRAYGFEAKSSVSLTRHVSLNGGLTKVANAYYLGGDHRTYVDSSPHFVANAGLTVSAWRGWNGSLRFRAVNHYRLDGDNASIVASGLAVFDMGLAKQVRRGVELNLSFDNLTNREFYETQNYLESRVSPTAPVVARIHATPGYPFTAVAGVTLRLRGK